MSVDFERIYATDLVFQPECWKLCGDAHCCSFSRYKSKFKLVGRDGGHQLPLLPGEYEWLRKSGLLPQFRQHSHHVSVHEFHGYRLRIEQLVAKEPVCPCSHAARTTVCRLYPLLPVFDDDGRVVGVDTLFGAFEILEELQQIERVCKVSQIPLKEVGKFLTIAEEIGKDPVALFYARAYSLTKEHVMARLPELHATHRNGDFFSTYELSVLRGRLIDKEVLNAALAEHANRFVNQYGSRFSLE